MSEHDAFTLTTVSSADRTEDVDLPIDVAREADGSVVEPAVATGGSRSGLRSGRGGR